MKQIQHVNIYSEMSRFDINGQALAELELLTLSLLPLIRFV